MKILITILFAVLCLSNLTVFAQCDTYEECQTCHDHAFLNGFCKPLYCLTESAQLSQTTLSSNIVNNEENSNIFNIDFSFVNNELSDECWTDSLTNMNDESVESFESKVSEQVKFDISKDELNSICEFEETEELFTYTCDFTYELFLAEQLQTTFEISVVISYEKLTDTVLTVSVEGLEKEHEIVAEAITPESFLVAKETDKYELDKEEYNYKLGESVYLQLGLKDVFLQSNYKLELVSAFLITPELDYIPLTALHEEPVEGGLLNLEFQAQWVRDNIDFVITARLVKKEVQLFEDEEEEEEEGQPQRRMLEEEQEYNDLKQVVSLSVEDSDNDSEDSSSGRAVVALAALFGTLLCIV